MLLKPRAWCFDRQSLLDAKAAGAVSVELEDVDTGTIYAASMARIWERGFPVSRGHGPQIGLVLSLWTKNGLAEPLQLALGLGGAK
jgi:hypothetical protein